MSIAAMKKIIVAPDVLSNVIDGETVLLHLGSERYFGLDEVGTRMWQVLTTSESIQVALGRLLDEYDVDPEQLQKDVDELVERLAEQELIELVDE